MAPEGEGELKQRVKKGHPQKLWRRAKKTENRRKRREEKESKNKKWRELARTCEFHCRRHWIKISFGVFCSILLIALFNMPDIDDQRTPKFTDKVIFEFEQNGTSMGSVTFGLFGQICPLTCSNFIMLSTSEKGYGYQGTQLFNVIKKGIIVGGDTQNDDGTGGKSALKKPFQNENFNVRHAGPGYLGMVSLGDAKGISRKMSQFYITLAPLPHMNRKSVIFGKVISGIEIIENIGETTVDKRSRPVRRISIKKSYHEPV